MFSEELHLNDIQLKALTSLGIESLTPMQEASLFACREPQDVILLSPTGTGKTLAYLLPLLEQLAASENPKAASEETAGCVTSIIVVPSRELAQQIVSVFREMRTPWRAMAVYGGRPAMEEHRSMRGINPSVIVGTPGRLNDHLAKGNIDASTVTTLIIDEFDKCLELGFHDEMQTLIARLPNLQRRRLLSATDAADLPSFTGLQRLVKLNYLASEPLPTAHRQQAPQQKTEQTAVPLASDTAAEGMSADTAASGGEKGTGVLQTYFVRSSDKDKLATLYRLLCSLNGEPAIVFLNYREAVERVGQYLREQRLTHTVYHGGLEQDLRERAIYRFRNGSANVLVSTDLASRGLDIPEVRHIIHYHLPANEEACIHRTGRTARWDADGNSWFLLGPDETLPSYVATAAEQELPLRSVRPTLPEWETLYIGKGKKDKLSRADIAGFLYKKGNLSRDDIGRIDVQDHYSYVAVRRVKVRQLLTLVQGEKIKGVKTIIDIAR